MRKNLKIDEGTHRTIKEFCDANYLKIGDWASSVLLREIAEITNVHLQNNKQKEQQMLHRTVGSIE